MDVPDSDCSSGCESGWTVYFEHSSFIHPPNVSNFKEDHDEEEEEEDLSMVSDASSGPPHFHEDEAYFDDSNNGCSKAATSIKSNGKRQKVKSHRLYDHDSSFLDDTASSPVFNLSSKNFNLPNSQASSSMESLVDFSQGFSATHFQNRVAFQDHFSFLQSSISGRQLQKNQ